MYLTTIALAALVACVGHWLGYRAFFSIYVPTLIFMSNMGSWLFYIQHQFPHTYWAEHAGVGLGARQPQSSY